MKIIHIIFLIEVIMEINVNEKDAMGKCVCLWKDLCLAVFPVRF